MSLFDLTALQLGAAIRAGEVSARDAAKASLDAIAARQGENNAFITVLAEQAMAQAKALDEDKEKLAVGRCARRREGQHLHAGCQDLLRLQDPGRVRAAL